MRRHGRSCLLRSILRHLRVSLCACHKTYVGNKWKYINAGDKNGHGTVWKAGGEKVDAVRFL